MQTFHRSPLATARPLTAAEVDALNIVYEDNAVNSAADLLTIARRKLLETNGIRSAVAEAISNVNGDGEHYDEQKISTARVVAELQQLTKEVEAEIATVRDERANHATRYRARMERVGPLRNAVARRVSELTMERDWLVRSITAARGANKLSSLFGGIRHQSLIAAGLTPEQIAMLGPIGEDPDVKIARDVTRVAVINDLLPPLEKFLQSNQIDTSSLEGYGFDELIEARRAAEQVLV